MSSLFYYRFEYGSCGHHCQCFEMNAHVFHDPGFQTIKKCISHPQKITVPYKMCEQVSKVALDWNEERINWMLNGKVVRTLPNTYWHRPLSLQFDSEIMEGYLGLPSKDDPRFPATFEIYYCRSYRRIPI